MKRSVKFLATTALLLFAVASALSAGFSGSISASGVTRYLWRGQLLCDNPAIQPSVTLNFNSLSVTFWGSAHDSGSGLALNESDYTVGFADKVPFAQFMTLKAGYTAYTFPYSAPDANNTTEIYCGIAADTFLAPSVSFYYDPVLGKGGYAEAGVSYSYPLGDVNLSASALAGYNFGQWGYTPSLTALTATIGAGYTLGGFTLTPSVMFQLPLDSQYTGFTVGSLSLAYNFSL